MERQPAMEPYVMTPGEAARYESIADRTSYAQAAYEITGTWGREVLTAEEAAALAAAALATANNVTLTPLPRPDTRTREEREYDMLMDAAGLPSWLAYARSGLDPEHVSDYDHAYRDELAA